MAHEVWIDGFNERDAETIWDYLKESGVEPPLPVIEMVGMYTIPGSYSATLKTMINDEEMPLACGGIIDMKWKRGEAWILASPFFGQYLKSCYKAMKLAFAEMINMGKFRRIQAVSYEDDANLLRHMGFEFEAVLKNFGPDCDGIMYRYKNGGS